MQEQQEEPGKRPGLELQIKTVQKTVRLARQGRPVHQAARPARQEAKPEHQAARPARQEIKPVHQAARPVQQGRPAHQAARPVNQVRQRQVLPRARSQEDRKGSWSSRTMPWIKRSNVWKQGRKDYQEIFTKEQGGKEV
jgi:hypothetical protein